VVIFPPTENAAADARRCDLTQPHFGQGCDSVPDGTSSSNSSEQRSQRNS
jgi:hypothetical protein